MIVFTEKFKKGDYIISRASGDMAVYDKTDNKGYMHFKHYYNGMFKKLKDDDECKKYTLQINYQKFWEVCNEDEKDKMDKEINKKKGDL